MPTARVNDYAGLLREEERARLEMLLAERERATSAQMVIAIFRSLQGEALEDYSIRLAQRWRIGHKGLDNGVILLVFLAERELRLEVGYGLEATITDAAADRIIRDAIVPRFREGRHAAGLEDAVREVFARIATPGTPERPAASRSWPPFLAVGFVVIVILLFVANTILETRDGRGLRRGRRVYTAGPRGWYVPPISTGWGGWGRGGGGGFSGGGGSFGGGGASGRW